MSELAIGRGEVGTGRREALLRPMLAAARANGPAWAIDAVVSIALPYLIYGRALPALGPVGALLASSVPPMAWSLRELALRRRVDAVSALALAGIALSLLAYLGGGSVHLLQLRERMVTGLIGLVFLGSAAIGRPLIYQLARAGLARREPGELAEFEALRDKPRFKRCMRLMTLVWGFGLVAEACVSCVLVFTLSVQACMVASPILGNASMGALSLWTFWYARRQTRIGRAEAQAMAARAV